MINDVKAALEVLQKGGVILYPTDTIWGLGCDAANEEAVKRIYAIKNRVDSKSMLVLMENAALLERYVDEVPDIAYDLIELSEKPMTIIQLSLVKSISNSNLMMLLYRDMMRDFIVRIIVMMLITILRFRERDWKPIMNLQQDVKEKNSVMCGADNKDMKVILT